MFNAILKVTNRGRSKINFLIFEKKEAKTAEVKYNFAAASSLFPPLSKVTSSSYFASQRDMTELRQSRAQVMKRQIRFHQLTVFY